MVRSIVPRQRHLALPAVPRWITANLHLFIRKIPWRLSSPQKARQRKRLRAVDNVVDTVYAALERNGLGATKPVERWYREMPREEEMLPRDKYTIFDRKEKKYRKGIHSTFYPCWFSGLRTVWGLVIYFVAWYGHMLTAGVLELPKWTRVSQRINPPGF